MPTRFSTTKCLPFVLAASLVAACADGPADTLTENGPKAAGIDCNPLAKEWDCLYPFPTNLWTRPDASLPGKLRVEIPDRALPTAYGSDDPDAPVDFLSMFPADGFSVAPQIAVRIPGGLDDTNLVFHTGDLGAALAVSSPTLLVDAETGELQLHFAEIDPRPEHVDDRALILRPLKRLKAGHRYVVALHDLKRPDGSRVPAPKGFAALRDGKASGDVLERMSRYYDAHVFPVLGKLGLERKSLQLAWDFTTGTDEHTTRDMLAVREDLIRRLARTPPAVLVDQVTDNPETSQPVAREIRARLVVPLYLDQYTPPSRLRRDARGLPEAAGTAEVPFTVRVPKSLMDGSHPRPGRIVQYGHGFFGSQAEARSDQVAKFANDLGVVVVAADWAGMSQVDSVIVLADLLSEPSAAMRFTDRVHQGMANFIALARAAKTTLPELDALRVDGAPVYDPDELYFYGISQGAILGATYLALSPDIDRSVLSVGGASFAFMMSRAAPFLPFRQGIETGLGSASSEADVLKSVVPSSLKVQLLLQTALDRIDPITYVPHLLGDTFPGGPAARRVLYQTGIGDAAVPNLAAQLLVRSAGMPLLQPAARDVFGIEQAAGPIDGSALVEYDFGVAIPDVFADPPLDGNGVHEGVRRLPSANRQIDLFLRPNGLIHDCLEACGS